MLSPQRCCKGGKLRPRTRFPISSESSWVRANPSAKGIGEVAELILPQPRPGLLSGGVKGGRGGHKTTEVEKKKGVRDLKTGFDSALNGTFPKDPIQRKRATLT